MRDTAAITPSSAAVSETVNVTAPDRSGNERLEAYTTPPYRDRDAVSIYGDKEVFGQCLSIMVGDESRRPQSLGSGRLRGGQGHGDVRMEALGRDGAICHGSFNRLDGGPLRSCFIVLLNGRC
jgi:hypothetical protein